MKSFDESQRTSGTRTCCFISMGPASVPCRTRWTLRQTFSRDGPDSRAKDWSDWLVSFRLPQTESRFVDVTIGEGMPAVWCEFNGVEPLIAFGRQGGKGSRGKNSATFFNLEGKASQMPLTSDTLWIHYEGGPT